MTKEDIISLCREAGNDFPQSYTYDDWVPHLWVIDAIQKAYEKGAQDAYRKVLAV